MTPSSEDIRVFLTRFRGVPFPHASEVISLLNGETPGVTIRLAAAVKTYRMRAEDLAARQLPPTFPATLPPEVRALADALDAAWPDGYDASP